MPFNAQIDCEKTVIFPSIRHLRPVMDFVPVVTPVYLRPRVAFYILATSGQLLR